MRKLIQLNVCFSGCYSDSSRSTTVRIPLTRDGVFLSSSEIRSAAIDRAARKLYGRYAFWSEDSGLAGYGQIFKPCETGGASSVTYRMGLDIDPIILPASHIQKLNEQNKKIRFDMQQWNAGECDAHHGFTPKSKNAAYIAGYEFAEFNLFERIQKERIKREAAEVKAEKLLKEIEAQAQAQAQAERQAQAQAEEDERAKRHEEKVMAEVKRIRSLPEDNDDATYRQLLNRIATITFTGGISRGDYKKEFARGKHGAIVNQYINSDWLPNALRNKVSA